MQLLTEIDLSIILVVPTFGCGGCFSVSFCALRTKPISTTHCSKHLKVEVQATCGGGTSRGSHAAVMTLVIYFESRPVSGRDEPAEVLNAAF